MGAIAKEYAGQPVGAGRGGDRLRDLRARRGLSTRRVADLSRVVASDQGSEEFTISHARLTQIENEESIPSIFKLFTLSAIYGIGIHDLLAFYMELPALGKLHHSMNIADTHALPFEGVSGHGGTTPFPVRVNTAALPDETNLLSRVVEAWAEVPFTLLERLNLPTRRYAWIGLTDYTMYPLLRPGTFVQIDECQRVIQACQCRNEYDRPIYFVELRSGYLASWCDVNKGRLISIPHPLSPCRPREFAYPREAEIVGRITGMAVRLVDSPRLQVAKTNADNREDRSGVVARAGAGTSAVSGRPLTQAAGA